MSRPVARNAAQEGGPPQPTRVLGRRVAAFVVDAVLHAAIGAALFLSLAERVPREVAEANAGFKFTASYGDEAHLLHGGGFGIWLLLVLAVGALHLVVFQGLRGASVGKLATGLRVVDGRGDVCGVAKAAVRWVLWIADGFPYVAPAVLGFIVAATTPYRQRVGDIVAGTYVVEARRSAEPS